MSSMKLYVAPVIGFILMAILQIGYGQTMAPSPSPAPAVAPSSDGTAIDQGIAYTLLLMALVVTYLIH